MALLLIDGMEDVSSAALASGTTPVTGRTSTAISLGGSTGFIDYFGSVSNPVFPSTTWSSTWTIGFALKPTVLSGANFVLICFFGNNGALQSYLGINTNGSITVYRYPAGTVIGTSAAGVLTASVWQYVEIQVKMGTTDGVVLVRVNGTTVLNLTSVNTEGTSSATGVMAGFWFGYSNSAQAMAIDDLYAMAGIGDSFLGDITVQTLYPNGNGAASAWVGSDADSVNNYLLVNEPNLVDTGTYTKSATVGTIDEYTLTDLTIPGTSIVGVCHQATVALAAAGSQTFALVNRRSADTISGVQTATSTSYAPFHYALANDPESASAAVLTEPFDTLTAWTLGAGGTITSGGVVGNFLRMSGGNRRGYPIPAPNQLAYMDVQFWFRVDNVGTVLTPLFSARSGPSAIEWYVNLTTAGGYQILRGDNTVLGSSATGLTVVNTWYRLRLMVLVASSNGTVRLDINGATVISATGLQTMQVAIPTSIYTDNFSGLNTDYDELVLFTAPGPTPWTVANVNALQTGIKVV